MSQQSKVESPERFTQWAVSRFSAPVTLTKIRSGAHSEVYRLELADKDLFLKVGKDLHSEKERMLWLRTKQTAVPEVIDFMVEKGQEALLVTAIGGKDLAHLSNSGYIDLLDMGVGSVEVDLSAAVWNLQLNLGPGYCFNFYSSTD